MSASIVRARRVTRRMMLLALPLPLIFCRTKPDTPEYKTPAVEFTVAAGTPAYDALEWTITVKHLAAAPAPFWYWAFQQGFTGTKDVYYMGLQPKGEFGKTALFSFFGKGLHASTASCKGGADGGDGMSCHIPYAWEPGVAYRFRIEKTASTAAALTWKGSVTDTRNGISIVIGIVSTPSGWGLLKPGGVAWAEWFKGPDPCANRTEFTVEEIAPTGFSPGKSHQEQLGKTTPHTCVTYRTSGDRSIVFRK